MKHFMLKKSLCLLLALVLCFGCCSVCFAAEKVTPVIVVSGMGSRPLVNTETGEEVFPPTAGNLVPNIFLALGPLLGSIIFQNEFLLDKLGAKPIHNIFGDLACDENGDSIKKVKPTEYPENMAYYLKNDKDKINEALSAESGMLRGVAEEIGYKNTYFFNYDWRLSPLDLAKDLDAFIKNVQAEKGCDKVSLFAMSMGGVVTSAYLDRYGSDSLKNVVFASTAFLGVELVGELFKGNLELTIQSALTYLTPFIATTGIDVLADLFEKANEKCKEDGMEDTNKFIKTNLDVLGPTVYSKIFADTFLHFLGVWSFVPHEDFEEAMKFAKGFTTLSESFITKATEMNAIQKSVPDLIKKAEKNGVNVYIVGAYGFAGIPLSAGSAQHSDTLIETYRMTGFCVVAPFGKTLKDITYSQNSVCGNKSHYHFSTDGVIDASVGLLPDRTWVVKNMTHVEFGYEHGTGDLAVWLVTSDKPLNVYSDNRFPQFTELDRKTGRLISLTENVTIPVAPEAEDKEPSFFERIIDFFKTVFKNIASVFDFQK